MNDTLRALGWWGVAAWAAMGVLSGTSTASAEPPPGVIVPAYSMFKDPLPMIIRSAIQRVEGKIDKLAFDPVQYRVFVTGVRTNTVYALKLSDHTLAAKLENLPEPRAVVWLPNAHRLVVACGGDGSVRIFKPGEDQGKDSPAYIEERKIEFAGESDAVIVDQDDVKAVGGAAAVWVAHAMAITRIDLASGEKTASVALPGRADGMVIGNVDGRRMIYVNVPRPETTTEAPNPRPSVLAIDSETGQIVSAWTLDDAKNNGAIALDEQNARLFVVTRYPAKLIVLDARDGREVARLDAPGDVGSICYDPRLQRLFAPGGAEGGKLAVFQRTGVGAPLDPTVAPGAKETPGEIDHYQRVHVSPTLAGCRTAVLDPRERLLIAAAPPLGGEPVFVFVYMIGP